MKNPIRRHLQLLSTAAIIVLCLGGCRGKKGDSDKKDDSDKPSESDESKSTVPASSGSLGMMSALLASQVSEPGPYEELDESPGFDEFEPHSAVIEVSGTITEVRSLSLLGGYEGTELRTLVDHLRKVALEEKVARLILRFGDLAISPALAEEFRTELAALDAKPIECHAEAVSTYTYWAMTACDKIVITTGGEIAIPGVAAVPLHMKGLLDKMGIRADFIHIGDYKGAAEPLTLDAPSKQSNETTAMILNEAYEGLLDAIAAGRKLDRAGAEALVDRAMFKAEDAVAAKLADEVKTFGEFRDGHGEWKKRKLGGNENPTKKLLELIGLSPVSRPTGERVALVYAVGNVVDGAGGVGATAEIASRTLVAALDTFERTDDVKAVVIRVSSPGGSALASEVIWAAVERLKAKKPVIVSMGGVAASGGYYIAAPATRIFALKNTLTGSIGVVGGKLAMSGGMAKLGIKAYPTGRGENALLFASPEPWSAKQREVVRASMRGVYDQFAKRVREGRGDIDDSLMQGRVWTGSKALEHKLIDEIGGLSQAIKHAQKLAGVSADDPLEVYPPEPTLRDMLNSFGVSAGVGLEASLVAGLNPGVAAVVQQTLALVRGFEEHSVQAALFFPLVLR